MKRYAFFIFTILLFNPSTLLTKEPAPVKLETDHVITLFMHPIDVADINQEVEKFSQALNTPGKLTRRLFKESLKSVDRGVYVSYAGFVDRLNANGQVVFPRKNQSDTITLIVTQKIDPVVLRGNTVEFFIRNEKYPIQYYQMSRNLDPKTQFHYWETKKIPAPISKKISPSTIVLFAKPDQIYIPEGKSIAMKGPNLLLPPIYPTQALAHNQKNINALSFLNINKYFEPIKLQRKYMKTRYGQLIRP
jgi:hypothetical protein